MRKRLELNFVYSKNVEFTNDKDKSMGIIFNPNPSISF